MIGVKPLFAGASLGENARRRRSMSWWWRRTAGQLARSRPALRTAQDREPLPVVPAGRQLELRADQADQAGRRRHPRRRRRQARPHFGAGDNGAATASKCRAPTAPSPATSVGFDSGFYAEASADTPDLLEIALDKPEYSPGDTMTVAVTARTAGKVMLNVIARPADHDHRTRTCSPASTRSAFRSGAIGAMAPMWWRRCCGRSTRRPSACPAAPSGCNGSRSIARRRRLRSI